MKAVNRWRFDVPVEGTDNRYMRVDDLMKSFHACKETAPEVAVKMALYAVESGSISAQFEYSKFLITTPSLAMSQAERYRQAEAMLLELLNLIDIPESDRFTVKVALQLGTLYAECMNRPVGALSLYLQASRFGAAVSETKLAELKQKLDNTDINQLGKNCEDSLRLGKELFYTGGTSNLAELFLREAVDKAAEELSAGRRSAKNLYAQACLALGDFYDKKINLCMDHEWVTYQAERDRMYAEAEANGFPEYLRRSSCA